MGLIPPAPPIRRYSNDWAPGALYLGGDDPAYLLRPDPKTATPVNAAAPDWLRAYLYGAAWLGIMWGILRIVAMAD